MTWNKNLALVDQIRRNTLMNLMVRHCNKIDWEVVKFLETRCWHTIVVFATIIWISTGTLLLQRLRSDFPHVTVGSYWLRDRNIRGNWRCKRLEEDNKRSRLPWCCGPQIVCVGAASWRLKMTESQFEEFWTPHVLPE